MKDFLTALLSLSAVGAILILLLLLAPKPLRERLTNRVQYALWLLVLMRLLLPVSLGFGLTEALWAQAAPSELPANAVLTVPEPGVNEAPPEAAEAVPPVTDAALPLWLWPLLLAVWALGAAVCLARALVSYVRLRRRLIRSAEPAPPALRALVPLRHVTLWLSPAAATPLAMGLVRSRIYLPAREYDQTELALILRHETAHLRCHDLLWKWLLLLASAIHWFNPSLILLRRELSRLCELACDERVLRELNGDDRRCYGETLLRAVAPEQPAAVPAAMLGEDKTSLKERLLSVAHCRKPTRRMLVGTVLLVVVAICFVVGLGAGSSVTAQRQEFRTVLIGAHSTWRQIGLLPDGCNDPATLSDAQKEAYLAAYIEDSRRWFYRIKPEESGWAQNMKACLYSSVPQDQFAIYKVDCGISSLRLRSLAVDGDEAEAEYSLSAWSVEICRSTPESRYILRTYEGRDPYHAVLGKIDGRWLLSQFDFVGQGEPDGEYVERGVYDTYNEALAASAALDFSNTGPDCDRYTPVKEAS